MLVLTGRTVGLSDQSYTGRNGNHVVQYHVTVAIETGVLVLVVGEEVARALGANLNHLMAFGTAIEAQVLPATVNDFGTRKPALKAVEVKVLADANGQAPAQASA